MSGVSSTTTCPAWCSGEHVEFRVQSDGRPVHPEDAGTYHHSAVMDTWHPMDGDEPDADTITVRLEGFRHDGTEDWPDLIVATNVHPGFLADMGLQVPDARRLAEAILAACSAHDEAVSV